MRKSSKKKPLAIVASTLLLLGVGGAAFAYWTAFGAGTGTGTTGTNESVVVVQTSDVSDLRPGGAAQPLSGNFDNPNDGPTYVDSVTVSISGVTKAPGAPAGTCAASDYTLAEATMSVAAEVPAGSGTGAWSGASVAFNNKADVNQDGCQGATVAFSYTSD